MESFAREEECRLNVETSNLNDRVNTLYNRMSKESDHQQSTRMLLDNSLKQMHLAALARDEFVDRELKELHGRVNRRLREVERVEARVKTLEEDNLALKSKIAEMEPRLCHCASGPSVVDKSAQAGSSSSYHSPPVAFENDIPLPVQVEVTVDCAVGALIPIPEDEDIEDVFRRVEDERREFERDVSLEILQREQDAEDVRLKIRRAPIVRNTKPNHRMSTGVVLGSGISKIAKPKRFDGSRGDLRGNRSRHNRKYMDRVNHEFFQGQSRQERGILSGWEAESESGRDSLPDYEEERECSGDPGRESASSCCGVVALSQPEGNVGSTGGDRSWSELLLAFGVDGFFVG